MSPALVLLAGGRSLRMGGPKGLLDFHGRPWILEQIMRFKTVDTPIVYIGLGHDHNAYFEAIPWLELAIDDFFDFEGVLVKAVLNKTPELGAFSTVQAVLQEINDQVSVLILPIDVPMLDKPSLKTLIEEKNMVVIPRCNGNNGHPVLLKPEFWTNLLSADIRTRLDRQIKQLNNSSITYVNVDDKSVNQNINTKKDWNNYSSLFS